MSNLFVKIKNTYSDKKFLKFFIKLVIPVMLTTFLSSIINFVDNVMVGAYSDEAVSSVYAVNQVNFIFNIMIFGVVGGAGIYIQQFSGKKDYVHLRQAFHFKIFALIFLGIICFPILFIFKDIFIGVFISNNSNKEVISSLANDYFNIVIFSFIPLLGTVLISTTLREMGHTFPPVIASTCSLITNILVNSLLINGVVELGVKGAAIATVLSQTLGLIVIIVVVIVKKYPFIEDIFNFKIKKSLTKKLIISSIPVAINELMWSLSMVTLSALYSQRGDVLSSLSISSTASEIFNIIFVGFSTGIGVMIGHYLGEGKIKEAEDNATKLLILAFSICIFSLLLMIGLSFILPICYSKVSQEQKDIAHILIFIYSFAIPFFGFNSSVMNILKAGGRTYLAFSVDSLMTWIIVIPLAAILINFTSLSLPLVYMIVCSMDIVRLSISIPLYKNKKIWARNLTSL